MENIDWTYLLFKFDGRINRAKYWTGVVATFAIALAFAIIIAIGVAINSSAMWVLVIVVGIALYVALIWMGFAIAIKRWHDRGKSGWWVLIGLVPIIGGLWALIETGFLEGTQGDNQYGPDPLAAV